MSQIVDKLIRIFRRKSKVPLPPTAHCDVSVPVGPAISVSVDEIRWPGAYSKISNHDPLAQGDILQALPFVKLSANPDRTQEDLKSELICSVDILPGIILNHDCDTIRDTLLQVAAVKEMNTDELDRLYPSGTSISKNKRSRFERYSKDFRQSTTTSIHNYMLPPSTDGNPFSGYHFVDLSTIHTFDFTGSRSDAQENRIGKLSRELMHDLLNAIHYRFTRRGRDDYFWLGPLDAIAKYVIESTDIIEKLEKRVAECEAMHSIRLKRDTELELARASKERELLGEKLRLSISSHHLVDFYNKFFEGHPDISTKPFISKYMSALNSICSPTETLPWRR